jgi:Na+/H+ antiporter NhaD/arsenite permease-like protein
MRDAALPVFVLTWCFIAFRKIPGFNLGRTVGTLSGATLMVAFGVLLPAEAFAAVDLDTLLLLFAMMLLSTLLGQGGTLDALGRKVLQRAGTPWRLLVGVSLLSAALSAFLVNDTACVMLTPFVVAICVRAGLPLGPYLIALATSANVGSALTLTGNPQNMIIGSMSGISYTDFLLRSLPAVVLAMAVLLKLLEVYYREKLPATLDTSLLEEKGMPWRPGLPVFVAAGVALGFLFGFHMGFTALLGVLVIVVARREEPDRLFEKVDWTLLVFFAALFVVVRGLNDSGVVNGLLERWALGFDLHTLRGQGLFVGIMVAGSNIVSNVPMVLLAGPVVAGMPQPELAWVELAFVTTLAGNLTLVGSVANLIVAEGARGHYKLGFLEYMRFGFVATLATIAAGIPGLLLSAWIAS